MVKLLREGPMLAVRDPGWRNLHHRHIAKQGIGRIGRLCLVNIPVFDDLLQPRGIIALGGMKILCPMECRETIEGP